MKTEKVFTVLFIFLTILVSGCESPVEREVELPAWFTGESGPPGIGVVSTPSPTPTVTQAPTPVPQTVFANIIKITQKDFELVPNEILARPGEITFILKNEGRYTHNFRVDGQGIDTTGSKVGVGRNGKMEVTLEEGVYRISCPLSNHDERGMVGTLTVRGE